MKNNNYYAVHKNKKPKRRLQNTNWKSFYDVISKANELVKNLLELRKATLMFAQPIPKYKQGGQNGNYPSVLNTVDVSGFDGKINRSNLKSNFGGITAEELTINNDLFIDKMRRITIENNTFFNKKASN
jgi:hypothetical protein